MSAFEDLLAYVRQRGVGTADAINPFWQKQLEKLEGLFARSEAPDRKAIVNALGYFDERLPPGGSNRATPAWARVTEIMESPNGHPRGQVEHAGALSLLLRYKVLDDYLATIDSLGLASNMALARHYWYVRKLKHQLDDLKDRRRDVFLEVGAGGGQYAMLLTRAGLVRHYVIADLPEMMLNSMITLSDRFPEADVRFGETPDFSGERLTFWFLDTSDIAKAPDSSVDVVSNFNSFMEMAQDIRDFYLDNIYRCAKPGALFYNVNRRQSSMSKRDGSPYDNNPLLFPYRASDRVLEWEPDQIQQDYRSGQFMSPHASFCISRMALIG